MDRKQGPRRAISEVGTGRQSPDRRARRGESLYRFVTDEALPGSGVDPDAFWAGVDAIVHDFAPRNRELLAAARSCRPASTPGTGRTPAGRPGATRRSCARSATSLDEPDDVQVTTDEVDDEVAGIAGPQLVVPLLNARFATNAANARWGSLYDALYGTDAIPARRRPRAGRRLQPGARRRGHRPRPRLPRRALPARRAARTRTRRVRRRRRRPRRHASDGRPGWPTRPSSSATAARRAPPRRWCWSTTACTWRSIDREDPIGRTDAAGVKDLLLEAAVSTIMDLEDSVAAVDAEDKVVGYRNWLR